MISIINFLLRNLEERISKIKSFLSLFLEFSRENIVSRYCAISDINDCLKFSPHVTFDNCFPLPVFLALIILITHTI